MKFYLIALFFFVGMALAVPVDNEKKDEKETQEAGDLEGAASGYWGGYVRPYYGGWSSYGGWPSYRPSYYSSWGYPGYYEPGWNRWGGWRKYSSYW